MIKRRILRVVLVALLVLAVAVVAAALRWRAVNTLSIDYDEDDYLRAAQQFAGLMRTGDWAGFTQTNYRPEHPPLAKIIYGISILPLPEKPLIPDEPTTAGPNQYLPRDLLHNARITAAIFGVAECIMLAIVNPLAGLFLALQTFTIKYTSQVMLEAFPAFTSLAVVLCYIQYKRYREKGSTSRWMSLWLIASAIFLGLTAASKYLYCVVGIAVLLDWLMASRSETETKKPVSRLFAWGLIAVVVFFLADPYLWPAPVERLKSSILFHAAYTTGASEVQQTGWPFWQPLIWLAQSVPWQKEVFPVAIDLLISILAIFGFSRMWAKERVFGLWLIVAIGFLLVWPTKWPQYILILTAPLSISAAEGFTSLVVDPVRGLWKRLHDRKAGIRFSRQDTGKAIPWLIPGVITLTVLVLYPLIYEFAMSLTDFSGQSIKDGIQGGIWRETWLGLTGQVEPVDISSGDFGSSRTVQYAGLTPIKAVFAGSPEVIVFEVLWTVVSVGLQAFLGIGLALLLNQRGVKLTWLWRTIFLLPWAIPEFVGALIWLRTFDPTVGWVPQAFGTSGGSGGGMLVSKILAAGGPNLAFFLYLIAATWIGFPIIMLAASASLRLVPYDVYDAAAIDGAARWSLFRSITWPLLLPLVAPVLIIRAIYAFNQFYLFYVFAPSFRNTVMGTFAYFSYFYFKQNNLYSISAAINIITVIVLIVLLVLFNRWSKASEGVTYA